LQEKEFYTIWLIYLEKLNGYWWNFYLWTRKSSLYFGSYSDPDSLWCMAVCVFRMDHSSRTTRTDRQTDGQTQRDAEGRYVTVMATSLHSGRLQCGVI